MSFSDMNAASTPYAGRLRQLDGLWSGVRSVTVSLTGPREILVAPRPASFRAVLSIPRRGATAPSGRYPNWSRRRVREAVSAVLPASSMALSYAARDF